MKLKSVVVVVWVVVGFKGFLFTFCTNTTTIGDSAKVLATSHLAPLNTHLQVILEGKADTWLIDGCHGMAHFWVCAAGIDQRLDLLK